MIFRIHKTQKNAYKGDTSPKVSPHTENASQTPIWKTSKIMKPCLERILEKFGYISMDPWSIFFPGTGLGIRGMGSAEPSTVLKCAGSAGSGL